MKKECEVLRLRSTRAPRTYPRWIEIRSENVNKKGLDASQVLHESLTSLHRLRAFADGLTLEQAQDLRAALFVLNQDLDFWNAGRDQKA